MLNHTTSFMVLTDAQGRVQELSKTSRELIGLEWNEVHGQYLWNCPCFLEPHQAEKIQRAIYKAGEGSEVELLACELRCGQVLFNGNFTVKPLYNEKNQLDYLLVEGTAIVPVHNASSQEQELLEHIPDMVIRLDKQLRIHYANPAVEIYAGISPEHLYGKRISEINLKGVGWTQLENSLKKVIAQRQKLSFNNIFTDAQKNQRHFHCLLVPELNEREEVISVISITRDISALIQRERTIQQHYAQLKAIMEGTSDIICAIDTDKRLIAFNEAYAAEVEQTLGARVKPNQSLTELLSGYPGELKNANDLWNRALRGEEFTILQEFGSTDFVRKYYEISFSPIYDQQHQVIGASSRSKSVDHKSKIEKELKDAREFLVLADNLPQIIFTARPNGQIDYLNPAFFDYTNLPLTAAENVDWHSAVHPEDFDRTQELWEEAVQGQAPGLLLELRLRNRYGLYRWHVARAVPIFNAGSIPVKWVGVISDIHEAKIAGELERLAAQEFKTIAESLPHIVWTTRADGSTTYFNSKWYEFTGEDPNALSEGDLLKYLHPEDRSRTQNSWNKALSSKAHYQIEYRLRHKSGRYRWFLARGVPVTDAKGRITKWFGTCTDIHENKLQRKRLQTQNDRLNQMNQYLDNFVHAAAHDLRSPVANLKGLLQLLQQTPSDKSGILMSSMESSLYRLDNTLQAMIHSIELQSLKQSPAKVLNLHNMFQQVQQEFAERLEGIPHEINVALDKCAEVSFIPFYLESLFRNLLSNSIKYRKIGQKLVIEVKCRPYRNYKLLEFSDNGIGIDVERYKSKLFQPFQRFTSQATGKGIGLHLINNIVTKTGGRITVKSKPGQGTTFMMYLKELEL